MASVGTSGSAKFAGLPAFETLPVRTSRRKVLMLRKLCGFCGNAGNYADFWFHQLSRELRTASRLAPVVLMDEGDIVGVQIDRVALNAVGVVD